MKPLPKKFSLNGFIYTQVLRTASKAVYLMEITPHVKYYTVFYIPNFSDSIFSRKKRLTGESYPRALDYGKTAWKFRSLKYAIRKFLSL